MLMRMLFAAAVFACWHGAAYAATACAPATELRKSSEPIVDWYDNFIRPYQGVEAAAAPRLTKIQVEAFIDEIGQFHRRAVLDQLIFEELVEKIMVRYSRAPDFMGIDTAGVEKMYQSGIGPKLDFSRMCISSKSLRSPHDVFGITLFGVVADDCQHVGGLRGLVFTAVLVNGSANGQCKPDLKFSKMVIVPVNAGVNEITFLCGKDRGGCARQ
jgi:hypothetical protein